MNQSKEFFDLTGRIALVTGGGQGIGQAIAQRLAAAGARVAVFDLQTETAKKCTDLFGGLPVAGNVTSQADIQRAMATISEKWGPVDILINNAGITGRTAKSWELSKAEWEQVLAVNLVGPVLLSQAAIPGMLERRFGRIINIASIAGKEGNPTLGPYSVSKAGLICFTKSLAKEVAGQGDITVNSISPAVIQTPILDGISPSTVEYMVSRIPVGRVGRPEEVAAVVHFLASSEASFTTGQCYDVSGGRATY